MQSNPQSDLKLLKPGRQIAHLASITRTTTIIIAPLDYRIIRLNIGFLTAAPILSLTPLHHLLLYYRLIEAFRRILVLKPSRRLARTTGRIVPLPLLLLLLVR